MAVNASQFNLVPNTTQAASQGFQLGQQVKQSRQDSRNQEIQDQVRALAGQAASGNEQAMQSLTQLSPDTAINLQNAQAKQASEKFKQADVETKSELVNFSRTNALLKATDPQNQNQVLQNVIAEGSAAGRDMSDSQALLQLMQTDPAAAQAQIDRTITFGQQIGVLEATGGKGGLASAKTEILEDGTVIQALPSGVVEVRDRAGDIVTGEARTAALDNAAAARQTRLDQEAKRITQEQQQRAVDKLEATDQIKPGTEQKIAIAKRSSATAAKAFDQLDAINVNILNLDDAIKAIDEGADTGPIADLFPSIRAASVKLNNIQGRLGLDVVGATTFGALSAGELALAKSTALPTGLDEVELRQWLVDKKNAQQKLAGYFEEQAIFLDAGNNQADWIKMKKEQQKQAAEETTTEPGATAEGATATNPQTGAKLTFRNGQWQ